MLTKVQIWKSGGYTSGFKVTYTLPDDEAFIGWPQEETHMFGFDYETSRYEEVDLTADLQKMYICVF